MFECTHLPYAFTYFLVMKDEVYYDMLLYIYLLYIIIKKKKTSEYMSTLKVDREEKRDGRFCILKFRLCEMETFCLKKNLVRWYYVIKSSTLWVHCCVKYIALNDLTFWDILYFSPKCIHNSFVGEMYGRFVGIGTASPIPLLKRKMLWKMKTEIEDEISMAWVLPYNYFKWLWCATQKC